MSEEVKNECNQDNETLKMICEVEKLYKQDFNAWEQCYQDLVKEVFEEKDNNSYDKKSELAWLDDEFVKKYPMFKYLKDNKSNVFSFIVMLNKYGVQSRQEIANKILNKTCETQFSGVPAGQQGLSEKTFNDIREKDDRLNEIAYQLIKDGEVEKDKELFDNFKLSDTFKNVYYILSPQKYYPSDRNTRKILKKIGKDKDPLNLTIEEGGYFSRALSYAAWIEENQVDNILNKFIDTNKKKPKNIILTGIPGTGKTYTVMEYLKNNADKIGGCEFVQFHPSYDYEDFIEGLKPAPSDNGQIEFKLVNGVFKELCKKAYDDQNNTYVMVIDEINRANLSRVFGELLYCLEYRNEFVSTKMTTYIESLGEQNDNKKAYSVKTDEIGKFAIPENIIILGTMNEVDRSIDAFDLALRRRFIWEEIGFSETALRLYTPFFTSNLQAHIEDLIKKAKKLNDRLSGEIGTNYQLGHTYYFKIIDYFDGYFDSALCDLWEYHLKSIVKEYCKVKFSENEIENKLSNYKKIIVDDKNCNG